MRPYPHLVGFNIGDSRLIEPRFSWIAGHFGITDFLTSQALPGTLPTVQGRLGFDFVSTVNPAAPVAPVFLDGLTVTPIAAIPEPAIYAMMGGGLGLLCRAGGRRKLRAA